MDHADADLSDREDMGRLVAGYDRAIDSLMERHATSVFHFLCRMLGNEDEAHDLAQEAFARVYRARETYQPGQRFSTWLFTIAANLARNQLRWRSRHPTVSLEAESGASDQPLSATLPDHGPEPDEFAEGVERHDAVRTAVRALPDGLREAILTLRVAEPVGGGSRRRAPMHSQGGRSPALSRPGAPPNEPPGLAVGGRPPEVGRNPTPVGWLAGD